MKCNRTSMRLNEYDYSKAGYYFITACSHNKINFFCDNMIINNSGKMLEKEWLNLINRFENIQLHEFIVMPNHIHGIIEICENLCQKGHPQGDAPTISNIVGAFKSITTNEYINGVKNFNWQRFDKKLWQRNYWDHIIRDKNEYNRIAKYIINNSNNWIKDKLNGGDGNVVMEQQSPYAEESWMI